MKINRVVYIIESPSDDDIFNDQREGPTLVNALNLFKIDSFYRLCITEKALIRALYELSEIPKSYRCKTTGEDVRNYVYIHLSAHGNKVGFGLSNGEFISWFELLKLIEKYWCKNEYISNGNIGYGALCLSSCEGAWIKDALNQFEKWPIVGAIATPKSIPWENALTGWITYYHLQNTITIPGRQNSFEVVSRMNKASDWSEDYFEAILKK